MIDYSYTINEDGHITFHESISNFNDLGVSQMSSDNPNNEMSEDKIWIYFTGNNESGYIKHVKFPINND